MTDQPIPDRSDELTTPPKLGGEDAALATGTGDPATSDAGPTSQSGERSDDTTPAGDAPEPSPDI
jgi:hypothetical protein